MRLGPEFLPSRELGDQLEPREVPLEPFAEDRPGLEELVRAFGGEDCERLRSLEEDP